MAEQRRRAEAVAVPVGDVLPLRRTRRPRERGTTSARWLLVGLATIGLAGGAYLVARETSAFAVRSVDVEGAPPSLAAQIRSALEPVLGRSLVSLDRADAMRRVRTLPEVANVGVDRAFPHTLRVTVQVEQPIAVLRQAALAWLVAADGRVLRQLTVRPYPALPRIWVPQSADVLVGSTLGGAPADALRVAAALTALRSPLPVRSIGGTEHELTAVLHSGLEVRLGDAGDLRLKLAVAARIVPLAQDARYVDVSVPERAVAESKPSS